MVEVNEVPEEEHAKALNMLSDTVNVLAKTRQFMIEYAERYPIHESRRWWDEIDTLKEDINVYRRSEYRARRYGYDSRGP